MASNLGKGKQVDYTLEWTPWEWDLRGFWVSSRPGLTGLEYRYEVPQAPEESTTPKTREWNTNPGADGSSPPMMGHLGSTSLQTAPSYTFAGGDQAATNSVRNAHSAMAWNTGGQVQKSQQGPYSSSSNPLPPTIPYPTTSNANENPNMSGVIFSPNLTLTNLTPLAPPNFPSSSAYHAPSSTGNHSQRVPVQACRPGHGTYPPSNAVANITHGFEAMNVTSDHGYVTSENPQFLLPTPDIRRLPGSKNYEELDPREELTSSAALNIADCEAGYQEVSVEAQRWFWVIGRVFAMLWTEPARGSGGRAGDTHYSTVFLGGKVHSKIRRFVVLRNGHGCATCSPIHTYNNQATFKPNLPERQAHAIIYTSPTPPAEKLKTNENGQLVSEQLTLDPIKVNSEQPGPDGDLGVYSRLNFSKMHTIEKFVRVMNIGIVDEYSMPQLVKNMYVKAEADLPNVQRPDKSRTGGQGGVHGGESSRGKKEVDKKGNSGSGKDKKEHGTKSHGHSKVHGSSKKDDDKNIHGGSSSKKVDDKKTHGGSHKDKKVHRNHP